MLDTNMLLALQIEFYVFGFKPSQNTVFLYYYYYHIFIIIIQMQIDYFHMMYGSTTTGTMKVVLSIPGLLFSSNQPRILPPAHPFYPSPSRPYIAGQHAVIKITFDSNCKRIKTCLKCYNLLAVKNCTISN